MKVKTKFIEMRELLKKDWCQGFEALDENDNEVHVKSQSACKFCLLGASYRICESIEQSTILDEIVKEKINKGNGGPTVQIHDWNDNALRKQEEVIALLDEIIKEANDNEPV